MSKLFRDEAVNAKKSQAVGDILLARPLSLSFLTCFFLAIVLVAVSFITLGEFTRKQRVVGRVVSIKGIVKIYSPAAGTVVRRFIKEGDIVYEGQPLYIISVDRPTMKGGTQISIGERIASKRVSLIEELRIQKVMVREEEDALRRKLGDLHGQLESLNHEIATQYRRLELSKATLQKFHELLESNFISHLQVTERESDTLDHQSKYQALIRARLDLIAQIASATSNLRNAPLAAKNRISNIERGISTVEQESIENEARREIVVVATQAGRIGISVAELGQMVSTSIPMLTILPQDGNFEVHLFVPSKAIGFIKDKDRVLLRFESFPYQKFGQYGGAVARISKTVLTPNELQVMNLPTEAVYRVGVTLDMQTVMAYGKAVDLQEGMVVDADVLLDRRKIYEWLLEPLYSLSGRV